MSAGFAPDGPFAKAGWWWLKPDAPAAKTSTPAPQLGTVADFVDGLAKQRAAATGETFEKAYAHVIAADGGVAYAALRAEKAARV